ncbi:DUF3592 domain-containing protein [Tautonia rosea]|uniref:DUF3592 domain-containing protein n=1 Tax=Tautonia rosea TaxID=2728037 RepID=UPI0014749159|nr:DUF3592 domain-containing protein [Tautonia rosea]
MTRARLIIGVVCMLGLSLAIVGGVSTIGQYRKLATYRPVEATVVSKSVDVHSQTTRNARTGGVSRSFSYRPIVRYQYEVEGRSMTSETVCPLDWPSFRARGARKLIDRYEVGQPVTAYVDPEDPSIAFLDRSLHGLPLWMIYAGLLPVMILVPPAGSSGVLGAIRLSALFSVVGGVVGMLLGLGMGVIVSVGAQLLGKTPGGPDWIPLGGLLGTIFPGILGAVLGALGAEQTSPSGKPTPMDDRVAQLRDRMRS